ncbi:hypothetical protein FRUB_04737 [Fimbriiglobus ruber]|uniref:Uncharacterized protein n=1 Tax=Fimbriiglobus ruber TaxID=1908690 RepID=A0A225DWZ9_9BACT|nr:hypothetical protein FRUB_04737 [Fimbriiglobus ruber]
MASAGWAPAGPLQSWSYTVTPGPELVHPFYADAGQYFLDQYAYTNEGLIDFNPTKASGLSGAQTVRLADLDTRIYVNTTAIGTTIPGGVPS